MRRQSTTFVSFFLMVSSLILAVPTRALALDAADLPSAIENAKTPADHEAIATYYDAEAKAALAKVESHRAMASAYAKLAMTPVGKAPGASYRAMPPHCNDLVKSYQNAAKDYTAMAAAHRKAASAIK